MIIEPELKFFLKQHGIHLKTLKKDSDFENIIELARVAMKNQKYELVYPKSSTKTAIIYSFIVLMVLAPIMAAVFIEFKVGVYLFFLLYTLALIAVTVARLFNQVGNKINFLTLTNDFVIVYRRIPTTIKYTDIISISMRDDELVNIDVGTYVPYIVMAKIERHHDFIREIATKYKKATGRVLKIHRKDRNYLLYE